MTLEDSPNCPSACFAVSLMEELDRQGSELKSRLWNLGVLDDCRVQVVLPLTSQQDTGIIFFDHHDYKEGTTSFYILLRWIPPRKRS